MRIDPYLVLGLALLVGGAAAGAAVQEWRLGSQISALKAEHASYREQAKQQALNELAADIKRTEEARKNAEQRAAANARAASAARRESDSLRAQLDETRKRISTSSCASVRNYAATLDTVFGRCTAALEGMARNADGHALDSRSAREAVKKE